MVVLRRGGLVVGKFHRVELVGLGDELYFLGNILELYIGDFMHLLGLLDVALKFWRVGRFLGKFLRNST